ncbi:Athe_2463 domain-containing protein [Acetivibrio clariflavus]|uniref:Uncharacterized protein n=1 Tax=Acetivibrio clariflavus (strain DSM 19732 / NBRC 101661 / EBR45) TaxID=720554 RepID=G8LWE4_ACECE|nr:hypothetical protein [Acetivibrio clariflavus]AEV67570.1 hypothetical protein Clocl_0889 [Acetivibrio clariflavus DSM 19732]
MRKVIAIVLAIFFITATVIANINATEEITRPQLVELANKELISSGIYNEEYFKLSNKNGKPLSTNPYLSGYRNYIVYGNPHGDFKEGRYRYLGYTMSDAIFTNYLFPNDVTSTTGLWDRDWIEDPKRDPNTKMRPEVKGENAFDNNPLYEESIRLGLKLISRKNPDGSLLDFPDDKIAERQWHKYVHIYQPPTSVSWGCGIMFHNNGRNYLTVPLSPEGLRGDLSVQFEEIPSSVVAGDKVQVLVQIKSTFKRDLTEADGNAPVFKWEIVDKVTNKPVPSVKYYGYEDRDTGKIEISSDGETALLAEFEMPEHEVNVKFEINKEGSNPPETYLDNNVLDAVITPALKINTFGDIELDYNILSRKVSFPLANGKAITAKLSAPTGRLTGNAWGALNIYNNSINLFRGFEDQTIRVNESAGTIIKYPEISTTIHRKDATYDSNSNTYDNPMEGKWLDGPAAKTATGKITFEGRAYANYIYTITKTNEDGSTYTETRTGITSADFDSGTDTKNITTKIYNGKPTIPAKTFENKIENNTPNYLQKNLWWTSEPYKLDVVRWMCHQDVDGSLYGWTAVPGRYKRTFTQQNSAVVKWNTLRTMKEDYKRSREAARNMDYRKSEYDKAVFSSDIGLKNVDYPIKAGYYFNPTGTYTFTVETVTYKPTKTETKDHKEIVEAVINSFRYESDLMYINSNNQPVNLQNELLSKSGNTYVRRPAALTAKDPTGGDGVKMLYVEKTNYTSDFEELKHSEKSGEYTHEFFKAILEGYEESGTLGSKENYKYREYIKDGQKMYKVTEKTTVIIKINPDNRKVYTYINMPDGKYTVAAWIGDIALSEANSEFKKLGTLKGVYNFDTIEVTVKGTLYDDQNSIIGR